MFRVEWLQSALDQLSSAWLLADSELRQAITTATHQVDRDLATAPENQGESRDLGERIHFVTPLVVTYTIENTQRLVTVLSVRVFRRPR